MKGQRVVGSGAGRTQSRVVAPQSSPVVASWRLASSHSSAISSRPTTLTPSTSCRTNGSPTAGPAASKYRRTAWTTLLSWSVSASFLQTGVPPRQAGKAALPCVGVLGLDGE